ncbi:MAG: carboxy-S-adenosyl-L-methionine synthase CmoA [Nitrospinaceae bacterium]|nr:carboxy-S-adenosyl-L-methionine synthase CmoA [Nitrospina sp.]MBT5867834.1 carboxy-S-adenosyl-L-methionine synthase CmoA [Nitrospinaceae bacterium]MBT6345985.1 carboxy-S-adenosyl-L-methionine synthase CmoA [Nitrospina sp.]
MFNDAASGPFEFNESVANVFEDMLQRSIPMYQECQSLAVHWCVQFAKPNTSVYDLGCSTGTLLLKLAQAMGPDKNITLCGVDNSPAMLKKCKKTLSQSPIVCELIEADFNQTLTLNNASAVVMNYTLQFVLPENREAFLKNIYQGLLPGGSLILIEKIKNAIPDLDRTFIEFYHQFKRDQGYSNLEISRKRDALENVLIPWTVEENQALIKKAGFQTVDLFFKWNNFAGFIALK